eukprot:m.87087 g.87087  ORF g.87087 m.87087 type:complete len:54 (+) comp11524_c1_seq2:455-616(+)
MGYPTAILARVRVVVAANRFRAFGFATIHRAPVLLRRLVVSLGYVFQDMCVFG